jgi:lipoprotein-anchoring transpeptidase ErfK/SrfK
MISRESVSRAVVATGAAILAAVALSQSAAAEDPVSYVWGRDEPGEAPASSGGRRQTTVFNPQYAPGQVIVSFGDRRLYLVTRPGQALSYPIAIPRDQSRWEGATTVTMKRENPSWTPTEEMLRENPRLPSWVPGGHPLNPLGVRALYLGSSTYRIHGTDAPWTIGQAVSKGCIRMYNEDVLDLYPRVPVGARVTVTWQRFDSSEVASNDGSGYRDDGRRASNRWPCRRGLHQRYVAAE